jgi:serine/threonine-protein kinase CTR1
MVYMCYCREYLVDLIGRPGVMSEPDSFLNGPSSILIASPLRLPELKSSLFTDEFRSLAKEYMTKFKFLDSALDNVSQRKLL